MTWMGKHMKWYHPKVKPWLTTFFLLADPKLLFTQENRYYYTLWLLAGKSANPYIMNRRFVKAIGGRALGLQKDCNSNALKRKGAKQHAEMRENT